MPDNVIRNQYLSAMGIDVWVTRENVAAEKNEPNLDLDVKPENNDVANYDWEKLHTVVNQCQRCELHQTRKNSVFGSGNKQAELIIIGTSPSNEEDNHILEFVGAEGLILDNILLTLKLSRKDIYTTKLLKCKSQNHRDYSETEMEKCLPYLERQIQLVNPKVMVLFGERTARFILKTNTTIESLSNNIHNYSDTGILVVVLEHPEQLLLSGSSKKQAWLTLLKIKTVLTPIN